MRRMYGGIHLESSSWHAPSSAGTCVGLSAGASGPSAALAGFDDHVGELLHFSRSAHVVEDGERLEVLRNAAGGSGCLGVQRVVQAQQLPRNQEVHCNACLSKDGAHLGHVHNRGRGGQSNTLH